MKRFVIAVLIFGGPGIVEAQVQQEDEPPDPAPVPEPPREEAPEPPEVVPPQALEPPPAPPPSTTPPAPAPPAPPRDDKPDPSLTIYGHVMLDTGYDAGNIGDPNWQDVLRPTKLPAFEDQFGKGGRTFWGVRQTRFGVKSSLPIADGELKTQFEFELFGTGSDEGQTTFRLRHAYGDWKQLRAGQTWSPFMDIDVFPNSLEYWGPNGMVFFRNVQLAWMPIQGDSRVTIALERPGASADGGIYADRVELENVVARFPYPDLSAEARLGGDWGYVELAGILRYIKWDDLAAPQTLERFDLSGKEIGWGVNLSSNLKLGKLVARLSAVYGHGIENYMNDGGSDIGPENTGDPSSPVEGVALPVLGLVGFVDANWSDRFTSTAGYSFVRIDNSNAQAPAAFHIGHYALANLLYHPDARLMLGPELQYGRRENFSDGWDVSDFRLQFSVKFNYEKTLGGSK